MARIRLNTMVKTNNGFEIAETDLQLRGPGNLEGTQQSGVLDLKVANIVTDQELLITVRNYVQMIFEKDPQLAHPENQMLNESLKVKGEGVKLE